MSRIPNARPVTDCEIYDALFAFDGNLSRAAAHLGLKRYALKVRIEKCPDLVALMEDLREAVVDQAEDNVRVDVSKGDPTASRFVLQTIGKSRGYTTGVSGTGKDGSIVVELRSFDEAKDA